MSSSSSSDSATDATTKEEEKEPFPVELLETVEAVLDYQFKNRKLLEAALTHPSVADADSYLRLKFIGGAALRLAFSNHQYLKYTDLDPQQLSLLREANLGIEKLACLAVRYGLYRCICHNNPCLSGKWVDNFVSEVHMQDQKIPFSGMTKAPQVLADIVESLAGAVYVDDELKLGTVWVVISGLLEPLVTLDMLAKPATTLSEAGIPKAPAASLLEKRKASGLGALLAKKRRRVSEAAPMAPHEPGSSAPKTLDTPPPPARRGRRRDAKASVLEMELRQMKARVAELEAELSAAQEASRAAETAIKAREEELARKRAMHGTQVEKARQEARDQALEEYGDEIVGVVNQHCFESHVRALTLARVAPRDPIWYNVEFPFEGTTPELKFPWEAEGGPKGEPGAAPEEELHFGLPEEEYVVLFVAGDAKSQS